MVRVAHVNGELTWCSLMHDDMDTFASEHHDVTGCIERGDGPEIDSEVWYVDCVEEWYIVCRLGDDTLTLHSHDPGSCCFAD
jgi:hypothetical protein